MSPPLRPQSDGRRIVICDYNALLLSVTGLLRMAGYCVFQAYDGHAAVELCRELPKIELLILNTVGTGIDLGELIGEVREETPALPVLHIGSSVPLGVPKDVLTIGEDFSPDQLLMTVKALMEPESRPGEP